MQLLLPSKKTLAGPWPWVISILRPALLLLLPLAVIGTCQLVSLQSLPEALSWLPAHLPAVGITWLVLLLAELVLFGLTRLVSLSYLLPALVPFLLTLVSYYKAIINGEPLMISDLALAGDLFQVASFAAGRITISPSTGSAIAVVALPLVVLIALDVFSLLGWERLRPNWKAGLAGAGGGALALLLVLAALRPYGIAQCDDYPAPAARDQACGVPLSLLSAWYDSFSTASQEYGPSRMKRILSDMEDALQAHTVGDVKPHIIFVMNESFFDITKLPGFTFSEDPLSNYHRLQSESTYGTFYTCTSGGGTGWVEMESFTGSSLSNTLTARQYDALPSYVRALRDSGYQTIAFHSHTDELYNRRQNYPHLGFDQVLFVDDYPDQGTFAGGYFDDDSTADVLISLFEEHRDQPTYLYAMTMQNHQPYHAGRYDPERVEVTCPGLSQSDLEIATCYVSGVYDADRMLGKLVDYFSQVDEPVILVFTGDHRPSLADGEGGSVYAHLGLVPTASAEGWSEEDYRAMLATDYLIWSNYLPGQGEQPNSAMMIGATILSRAQLPTTPYFAWLDRARQETVLYQRLALTVGPDGQLISADDPEVAAFLSAREDVIYDLLDGEGYLLDEIHRTGP